MSTETRFPLMRGLPTGSVASGSPNPDFGFQTPSHRSPRFKLKSGCTRQLSCKKKDNSCCQKSARVPLSTTPTPLIPTRWSRNAGVRAAKSSRLKKV